jgi:hypothetical protein
MVNIIAHFRDASRFLSPMNANAPFFVLNLSPSRLQTSTFAPPVAFGFESDHVDENFLKKGEEKEKEFAKTQVRCVFAMLFVYLCKSNRCLSCPHQPSLPARIATLL